MNTTVNVLSHLISTEETLIQSNDTNVTDDTGLNRNGSYISSVENLTDLLYNHASMTNQTYIHNEDNTTDFLIRSNLLDENNSGNQIPLNCFLIFLMMAVCYSMKPQIPDASHHHGLIWREQQRRREEKKKDPNRRKRFIEASLITKRVVACDNEKKDLQLDDPNGSTSISDGSFSMNSLEEEENTCVICLDTFQKGDIVTWSKNTKDCRHVFHQECLEGWLANPKNDDCPYCRCQIICDIGDDDDPPSDDEAGDDNTMSSLVAYVIRNGLISPLRRASSLIGSSVDFNDNLIDFDDSTSTHSASSLKRNMSFGSISGTISKRQLKAVFRRASSGLSASSASRSRSRPEKVSLKEPEKLQRSLSEGLHTSIWLRKSSSSCSSSSSPHVLRQSILSNLSQDSLGNSGSFDGSDMNSGKKRNFSPVKIQPTFLQTLTEGFGTTPRIKNYQKLDVGFDDDDKLPLNLELQFDDDLQNDNVSKSLPRPRISFGFNHTLGGGYSKVSLNDGRMDTMIMSDEEESLVSFSVEQEDENGSIESMV